MSCDHPSKTRRALLRLALLPLAAVAALPGCATVPRAAESADAAAKQFTPVTGASVVYVYRNESLGALIPLAVGVNGKSVAHTGAYTYLRLELPAGRHTLTSDGGNPPIELNTEAGKVYFVWQEMRLGLLTNGAKLKAVADDVGKKGVLESKLIQTTAASR